MSPASCIRYFVLVLVLAACAAEEDSPHHNIVLIIADDLGFSDLGAYGGEISTPHIDGLAAEGVRFTQFYTNAVCVPTRASLYTGLYPVEGLELLQDSSVKTLGDLLSEAGYRTSLSGKWHLGHDVPNRPIDRGFDEYYGLLDGASNHFDPSTPDPEFYIGDRRNRIFAHNDELISAFPDDFYSTDAFTDHAVRVIREFSESDEPFFLNVSFTSPHFPLHAKPEDIAAYKGSYDSLGDHETRYFELRERRYRRQMEMGLLNPEWGLSERNNKGGPWRYDYDIDRWLGDQDSERELRRMEVYAAMVTSMDEGVGKLLEALEENGLADNTVVIFISDNGGAASVPVWDHMPGMHAYNQSLPGTKDTYEFLGPAWGWAINSPFRRHKGWVHEGGISSPLIVRWPLKGQEGGSIRRDMIHIVDLAPTILDIAQVQIPQAWPGRTVTEILSNEVEYQRPSQPYYWNILGNKAIRDGKWKLVSANGYENWELYDMENDRTETQDLADQRPELVKKLSEQWSEWNQQRQSWGE